MRARCLVWGLGGVIRRIDWGMKKSGEGAGFKEAWVKERKRQ